MNRARSLALAAGLAAAAAGAAPAIASAGISTCTYLPQSKTIFVYDHSGAGILRLFRTGDQLRIDDGNAPAGHFCPQDGGGLVVGTVTNTDKVVIFGSPADSGGFWGDGYTFDETGGVFGPGATLEADGNSEIEIQVNTVGTSTEDTITGTSGNDDIRVGKGGAVNFRTLPVNATDNDDDLTFSSPPHSVVLRGGPGDDLLSGNRNEMPGGAASKSDVPLQLLGGDGSDLLIGGAKADSFEGDAGDDYMDAVDNKADGQETVFGLDGYDQAVLDTGDTYYSTEAVRFGGFFGRGAVKPGAVSARAGQVAHVKIGWSHHAGWRQLKSLTLQVADGGRVLRTVKAANRSHDGKWLWADAALTPSRAMAGRALRLQVVATDVHGRTDVEPLAGTLTVR